MVTDINLDNADPVIAGPVPEPIPEPTPEPTIVTSPATTSVEPVTPPEPNHETPGLPPLIETQARHDAYKRRVEGMTPLTYGEWLALRKGDWVYINNVDVFGTCIVSDVYSTRDATYIVFDNVYANHTLTFKRESVEVEHETEHAVLVLGDGSVFAIYRLVD